jgi:drug/metabolite transporter (DMT)-like permease
VTVVLGLFAAMFYGVSDFVGGFVSRRHSAVTVLLHSYPVGAVLMVAMLPLFPGHLDLHVAVFGVLGGASGLVGVTIMYQLMVNTPMNIVSPVTAVLAAIVPVVFGVALGERPRYWSWLGIVVGIAAVILVSRTNEDHPHGRVAPLVLALAGLSGLGFGFYFVFLAKAGGGSGLWPLVISRVACALLIVPISWQRRAFVRIRGRILFYTLLGGALDAFANMFFLLATHVGLLSLASVLTSLYPAVTVMLAVGLLHERTSRMQRVGLALAAASVVLITV